MTAARSPPRSEPANSHALRPSAMPRNARSAALLLMQIRWLRAPATPTPVAVSPPSSSVALREAYWPRKPAPPCARHGRMEMHRATCLRASPVGAFAEYRPARSRFIDRHDRRHLAVPLKKVRPWIAPRPDLTGARGTSARAAISFVARPIVRHSGLAAVND